MSEKQKEVAYGIDDIETLSFKEGVRQKISMYLGSADMQGVYGAIQEIISNSIDEYYMGSGKKIEIELGLDTTTKEQFIIVTDNGRGVPFGKKADGTNVLIDIFTKPHTGGKFSDKAYRSVAGLNGIGAKATCLSSSIFDVSVVRDGIQAKAGWKKGIIYKYEESPTTIKTSGTSIRFSLDKEVYNLEPINIKFEELCSRCKTLSYLTKGLTFILREGSKRVEYCAKNGLMDLIENNVKDPIHSKPFYCEMEEDGIKVEIAMQWTKNRERSFVFTNGLEQTEGGTSLTGVKTAITTFMKKKFKEGLDGDMARTGLVYAVSCTVPNPSFANQTKTKINNPELRGLCQRATGKMLTDFEAKQSTEFIKITEFLSKEKKAEIAAQRARRQVLDATKDIEKNQKKKVFNSDKLKDAEYLGPDSILLIVEGDSAAGAMATARDSSKYGILGIRGKMINCLSNTDEKIYANEEVKLFLSSLNIVPGKYNSKKLRYGKLAVCVDADSDK